MWDPLHLFLHALEKNQEAIRTKEKEAITPL